MKRLPSVILLSLGVAACATVGPSYIAILGEEPAVTGGTYSSGGGLTVAADVRENDGRTMLCGVWAQSRQQSALTKGAAERVIASATAFLGDERLHQNLLFMRETAPSAAYGGQEAGCIVIDRPWSAQDGTEALVIRIPRQVIVYEGSELGGFAVTFTQTGPSAGP